MMNVVVIGLEAGNHLETREASLWEKVREENWDAYMYRTVG